MVDKRYSRKSEEIAPGPMPVAQYVRMSTEHQRYSTENQTLAIAEYAQRQGMRVVRTYGGDRNGGQAWFRLRHFA